MAFVYKTLSKVEFSEMVEDKTFERLFAQSNEVAKDNYKKTYYDVRDDLVLDTDEKQYLFLIDFYKNLQENNGYLIAIYEDGYCVGIDGYRPLSQVAGSEMPGMYETIYTHIILYGRNKADSRSWFYDADKKTVEVDYIKSLGYTKKSWNLIDGVSKVAMETSDPETRAFNFLGYEINKDALTTLDQDGSAYEETEILYIYDFTLDV